SFTFFYPKMANHVSSSSAFTNQLVYPSSDASEYPFWDAQCEQFPLTYFSAINNDEPLINMDFEGCNLVGVKVKGDKTKS
ncbi:hypothetical protein, partial [Escherichia coli]|uniref:hypothetical protein n=1 Tax=Escherichia coli TaxID=562 RepID=UPI0032DBDA6E